MIYQNLILHLLPIFFYLFTINFTRFIFKTMEKKKECNTCKKQTLNKKEWIGISIGLYLLVTSIYGTIHFIKHLMN